MNNIFTSIINTLATIPVSGEENIAKMYGLFTLLHQMEKAANEPDEAMNAQPEVTDNG